MHEYLSRALACMETAANGMDVEALRRHPPGKWSSVEILEHLSLAFSSTTKVMARQLASHQTVWRRATWRERLSVLLVIEFGYLPKGRKAPEFTVPHGMDAAEALPRFRQTIGDMDEAISRCERQFGPAARIAEHTIFGPLTARRWRRFHWVHTRHHAAQVARLKRSR